MDLTRVLHWLIALALVATLYGHTAFGINSAVIGPIAGAVALCALIAGAFPTIFSPVRMKIVGANQQLAALLGSIAITYAVGLTIIHFYLRVPSARDFGLASLQIVLPLLMSFQLRRRDLLGAIGIVCVCTALADAVWNYGVLAGVLRSVSVAHRSTEYGQLTRYPGISGSTLAAGLVGLVGVSKLTGELISSKLNAKRLLIVALVVIIFVDLYFIDARRYLAESIIVVAVMASRSTGGLVPLPLVAFATSVAGLWFTFHGRDPENVQRSALMISGLREAKPLLLVGEGPFYRAPPLTPDYQSLWAAGVTESGAISLVISFGLPVSILFFSICLLALGGQKRGAKWESVLFSVLVGDLAVSETLDGFLGASIFFACLSLLMFDEANSSPIRPVVVAEPSS